MSVKTKLLAAMLREVSTWANRQGDDPYYAMARAVRSSDWLSSDEGSATVQIDGIVLNDAEDSSDMLRVTDIREATAWLSTHKGRAVVARDAAGRRTEAYIDTRIDVEYAVDHRDQPPMFACIIAHPDRSSAEEAVRRTGRPLLRREVTSIHVTGDWQVS